MTVTSDSTSKTGETTASRLANKPYAPPQLVPLDETAVLNRLREAAAKGNAEAKLMLEKIMSGSSHS
jgi:hypothetical protein